MKNLLQNVERQIQKYFFFKDPGEFVIFLIWGLFVTAFLTTMAK